MAADGAARATAARARTLLAVALRPLDAARLRGSLAGLGYTMDEAADGVEAVEIARSAGPGFYAAILLDPEAPCGGIGLVDRLRLLPGFGGATIIALVGGEAAPFDGCAVRLPRAFDDASLAEALAALERREAPSSAPRPVGAGPVDLSLLKHVDVDSLETMLGDTGFISKLLAQFRSSESGVADAIDAAVAAGDMAETRRLSHRVKGVSGNLRIASVFDPAVALEKAACAADAPSSGVAAELARSLTDALRAVFAEIDDARRESAPSEPGRTDGTQAVGSIARRLDDFITLLRQQDLAAEDVWADLAGVVRARDPEAARLLDVAVDALRYDEARAIALRLFDEVRG